MKNIQNILNRDCWEPLGLTLVNYCNCNYKVLKISFYLKVMSSPLTQNIETILNLTQNFLIRS